MQEQVEVSGPDLTLMYQTLNEARTASVVQFAREAGKPLSSETDLQAAREAFFRLPYEVRRKYHVRPRSLHVALARISEATPEADTTKAIVKAYKESGDASHALKAGGLELGVPWVEQKRNSQGIVEILESDLYFTPIEGHTPLEVVEDQARDKGLYENLEVEIPAAPGAEIDTVSLAADVMRVARERIAPHWLAIYLLTEVDSRSLREVAREFSISYREVRRICRATQEQLRAIAVEVSA